MRDELNKLRDQQIFGMHIATLGQGCSKIDVIKDAQDRTVVFPTITDFLDTYYRLNTTDHNEIKQYITEFDKLVEMFESKYLALAIIFDPELFLKNVDTDIITIVYGMDLRALCNRLRYFFIEQDIYIDYMVGDNSDDIIRNNTKGLLRDYTFNKQYLSAEDGIGYFGLDTSIYNNSFKSFFYSLDSYEQNKANKELEAYYKSELTILECPNILKAVCNAIEEARAIIFKK